LHQKVLIRIFNQETGKILPEKLSAIKYMYFDGEHGNEKSIFDKIKDIDSQA